MKKDNKITLIFSIILTFIIGNLVTDLLITPNIPEDMKTNLYFIFAIIGLLLFVVYFTMKRNFMDKGVVEA